MSIKDRNKHAAAAKIHQKVQGRDFREESKATVAKIHKVQKSSDYLATAAGQAAAKRVPETRILCQEVRQGVRLA
jgi:hypothetical protein